MKQHLLALVVIAIILASIFTVAITPTPAHAACTHFEVYGPWSGTVSFLGGHSYTEIYDNLATPGIDYTDTWTPVSNYSTGWNTPSNFYSLVTDNSVDCGAPLPLFTDGRENNNDAGQTAAVYCGVPNSGDARVYALFNNVGSLAFTVTKVELAAGVQKPASPYLIKAAKGAELWRLQDGSLRIKRSTYVFDWPGC